MKRDVYIVAQSDDAAKFVTGILDADATGNMFSVHIDLHDDNNELIQLLGGVLKTVQEKAEDSKIEVILAWDTNEFNRDWVFIRDYLGIHLDDVDEENVANADFGFVSFCPGAEKMFNGDKEKMKMFAISGEGDGEVKAIGFDELLDAKYTGWRK